MTRSMAIKWLKWIQNMFPEDSEQYKALQLGIDSMEVDEAYQLEYESTTKNDLALLEKTYDDFCKCEGGEGWLKIDGKEYGTDVGYAIEGVDIFMEVFKRRLAELPSVTPQEPQTFKWCTDCKEYDQEKHCCHRWSKVIRDAVEEMKQEPKTGHWINKQNLFSSCSAECSSCHKRSNGYVHDNGFSLECKYFNFCPNCGSDNREVEDGNDD